MDERDFEPFAGMLEDIADVLPNAAAPTAAQKALFFKAVCDYSIAQVRKALDAHLRDPQRGRFFPVPADVVAQIEGAAAHDGRPGAEEAWAMMPTSESESVVWTEEMAEAFGVVGHLMHSDAVAARMSFKQVYQRLVSEARASGRTVRWTACLGDDSAQHELALASAVRAGRLTQAQANYSLPALAEPEPDRPRIGSLKARENRHRVDADVKAVKAAILSRRRDDLAWARDLRKREESGEQLTDAMRQLWRRALHHSAAGTGATEGAFIPIPADCLPPGMRWHR